jgi:hypothetical protein
MQSQDKAAMESVSAAMEDTGKQDDRCESAVVQLQRRQTGQVKILTVTTKSFLTEK